MTVLDSVVVAQPPRMVALPAFQNLQRSPVRCQAVGDNFVRQAALALEELSQQFQGSGLVSALRHKCVQNLAFLVDGSPHEHAFAVYPHHHLIEMPHAVGPRSSPPDVGGDSRPELVGAAANRFVADINPTLSEHFLDVAQAGGEAGIEPDCQSDRVGWEPMALGGNRLHRLSLYAVRPRIRRQDSICMTAPWQRRLAQTIEATLRSQLSKCPPGDITKYLAGEVKIAIHTRRIRKIATGEE